MPDSIARRGMSFAQQRLWFLARVQGAGEAYHMPLAFRLDGPLDRGVLARALNALAERHEAPTSLRGR